jgi:hypothetical protein
MRSPDDFLSAALFAKSAKGFRAVTVNYRAALKAKSKV